MALVIKKAADISETGAPCLGMNLAGISDNGTTRFIDRAKQARGWLTTEWATSNDLPGAVLDNGEGGTERLFFFHADGTANTGYRGGTFRVTWDGSGTIVAEGSGASNLSGNASGATFDLDGTKGNTWLKFSGIDWGNVPRDVKIIRTDLIAAHDAGAIYDPTVVTDLSQFSCLRFMDWMATNSGRHAHWADRKLMSHQRWEGAGGVPLEACIDLCNRTGCDGWFNIPHMATDDYIRNFVQLVHDTLDPSLVAWFEFSNEIWNWNFYQTLYARRRAWELWGPAGWSWDISRTDEDGGAAYWAHWDRPDWETTPRSLGVGWANDYNFNPEINGGYSFDDSAHLSWYGKRSTEMSRIVREIYGRTRRVRTALNIQTVSSPPTHALYAPVWAASGDPNYVPPHTMHDAIAITGYFGHDAHNTPNLWTTLSTEGEAAAKALLLADCEDDLVNTRIPAWQKYADLAKTLGLDLVMYEGNHHMILNTATGTDLYLNNALRPGVYDLFTNTAYSAEMAALLGQARAAFRDVGGKQYMGFVDISPSSVFGWWGYRRWRTDASPNWTGIADWQDDNPRWWIR